MVTAPFASLGGRTIGAPSQEWKTIDKANVMDSIGNFNGSSPLNAYITLLNPSPPDNLTAGHGGMQITMKALEFQATVEPSQLMVIENCFVRLAIVWVRSGFATENTIWDLNNADGTTGPPASASLNVRNLDHRFEAKVLHDERFRINVGISSPYSSKLVKVYKRINLRATYMGTDTQPSFGQIWLICWADGGNQTMAVTGDPITRDDRPNLMWTSRIRFVNGVQ